jgi:AmmeMemoRadiSam system protein A
VDLRNSGDTAGDLSRVVGYAGVVFEPPRAAGARPGEGADHTELSAALVGHARHAIAEVLGLADTGRPVAQHPALAQQAASFVTLRKRGALRGCVGALQATRALVEDVRAHAVAAASRDPRFAPVQAHEFAALEIEVSVLGPTRPLAAATEAQAHAALRPGIDGLVLEWRGARATFLPQVWEGLPEPRAFLDALRRKAGLPRGFWADDMRLSRYEVRKYRAATQPVEEPI